MLIGLLEEENELHGELEFGAGSVTQKSDHYHAKISDSPYKVTKIKTVQLVRMEGE